MAFYKKKCDMISDNFVKPHQLYICEVITLESPDNLTLRIIEGTNNWMNKLNEKMSEIYSPFLNMKANNDWMPSNGDMCPIKIFINMFLANLSECSDESLKEILQNLLGELVVVHYEGKFHRATIESWESFGQVSVLLIDTEKRIKVSIRQLMPMADCLLHYPCMVLKCKLGKVQPIDGSWSNKGISMLKKLLAIADELYVEILPVKSSNMPTVRLFDNTLALDINDALIKKNVAKPAERVHDNDNDDDGFLIVPEEKNDYIDLLNFNEQEPKLEKLEFLTNDPVATLYGGYAGNKTTCEQFMKTGRCYKGDSCRKDHIQGDLRLINGSYTMDQESAYAKAKTPLRTLKCQDRLLVEYLSEKPKNGNVIYGLLVEEEGQTQNHKLVTLETAITTAAYQNTLQRIIRRPEVNQLVVYLFQDAWRRAQVLPKQPNEADKVFLFLVDWGIEVGEPVHVDNLREIRPEFLELPLMARQLALSDVKLLVNEQVAVDELSRIISLLNVRSLYFVFHFEQDGVCYGDFDDNQGFSLKKELIDLKIYIREVAPFALSSNCPG